MTTIYKSPESAQYIEEQYKDILDDWPIAFKPHFVPTSQGKTFVIELGVDSAPKVILLHGSMSNSLSWINEMIALAEDYHVFAIDIIGEPGLSEPSRPSLTSTFYSQWLFEVVNTLSIQRTSIIGLSLGGWFALDFVVSYPEIVENLILISPGGIGAQKNILYWVIPLSLCGKWGKNKVRELMLGKPPKVITNLGTKLGSFFAAIPKHFRPRLEKLPIFSDQQLSNISVPTLAIIGGKDMMLDSSEIKRRTEKNIPNLNLNYLPLARHFPGNQSDGILKFLNKHNSRKNV